MSIWSGSSGLHSILIIQSSLQMLCVCGFISGTLWRACLLYQELTTNLLTSNKGRWLLESSATCCSCAPGPRVVHTWRRKRGVQVAVPRREQSRGEQRRAEQRKAEHITAHHSTSELPGLPLPCPPCAPGGAATSQSPNHRSAGCRQLSLTARTSQLPLWRGFKCSAGFNVIFLHCFTLSNKETAASYSTSLYPDILKGRKREHKWALLYPQEHFYCRAPRSMTSYFLKMRNLLFPPRKTPHFFPDISDALTCFP